jgi:hypothetical protein
MVTKAQKRHCAINVLNAKEVGKCDSECHSYGSGQADVLGRQQKNQVILQDLKRERV